MSEHEQSVATKQVDDKMAAVVDGLESILTASPNDHEALEILAYIYE